MKILVLGSLGVELPDGDVVHVRGLQATLITELLAAESMVVSTDRLADALYGEDIPRQPLRAVHAHMTRLRRALRQWEPEGPGAERLLAKATGYVLKVSPLESDAGQFLAELARVRTLDPLDAGAAMEILEPAMDLWRGPVLEGTPTGTGGGRLVTRLEAARREAAERLASVRLALGHHTRAITDLQDLLLENPYDESLARLLATALYRSGRPHEAQRVEQRIRRALRDELGAGPDTIPASARPGGPGGPGGRGRVQRDLPSARLLELVVDGEPPVCLRSPAPPRTSGPSVPMAGIYRVGGFPVAVFRDTYPEHSPDVQSVLRTLEYARKACLPVALLVGEPGRRPVAAAELHAHRVTLLRSLVQLRGVVPRVVISFDDEVTRSLGAGALGDAFILVRPDRPDRPDRPGGADGRPTTAIEATSVVDAAASARELLDYLTRQWAPASPPRAAIEHFRADEAPVDMRGVIAGIADGGDLLELMAEQGPSVLTGLARIEGKRVGVIANNPAVGDGALTPQAASKGRRMVDLCALWNIPLLVLVDTPQVPGTGVSDVWSLPEMAGAELLNAFLEARVPRVTVLVGRAEGWPRLVMGARESGADAVYAWPRARTDLAEGALDGVIAPQATRAVVSTLLAASLDRRAGA